MSRDIFKSVLAQVNGTATQEDLDTLAEHSEWQKKRFEKKTVQPDPPVDEMTSYGSFLTY